MSLCTRRVGLHHWRLLRGLQSPRLWIWHWLCLCLVSSTGARTPTAPTTGAHNSSSVGLAGDQRSTAALDATQAQGSSSTAAAAARPSATTPNAASGAHPGVRIPNRRHGATTPATGTTTTGPTAAGASAANGPTRIPLSQRRDPPPKLSLTLDLSVTNPRGGNTSKYVDPTGVPLASALRRRDAVVPDSSYGIAASSGVVRL